MRPYEERLAEARACRKVAMERVAKITEAKEKQKFPIGTRVFIAEDLGDSMSHFPSGCNATVLYTYAQAYNEDDFKSYALDIDGHGESAWYYEHQLEEII